MIAQILSLLPKAKEHPNGGLTTKEIALQLGISTKEAHNHLLEEARQFSPRIGAWVSQCKTLTIRQALKSDLRYYLA